ncbi:hypothetical protein B4915_06045 [Leucobacter massiliensis]|uniref:Uncharacterized protein n=1 Tax=Leucobacter massiliensis TaxID=1686285 RepID=A0A2S9QP88_9MICO|nr:hypothetical protein B4915_06045 [Leucobacter massiliensis]
MPGEPGRGPRIGPDTVLTMSGTAEGQNVTGFLPADSSVSDPSEAYPATPPPTHTEPENVFAGLITADEVGGEASIRLFCIDIRTSTYNGIGYVDGSWEESGMPNLGYVARILNDYYPNSGEPSSAPDDNVRAAAVQAALWYFTDNYVLSADSPVRPFTEEIVNTVRQQEPLPSPEPPALTVTPSETSGTLGTPGGPFTVNTDSPDGAELEVIGGTMFADAEATIPIPDGTTVPDGQLVWVLPDTEEPGSTVELVARGSATTPSGNVFLYDGYTPGMTDAQRLILAESVSLTSESSGLITFLAEDTGSLTVTKSFAGADAGAQDIVEIDVTCDNGSADMLIIPAGATEAASLTLEELPLGTSCEVTEPATGGSETVIVVPEGLGTVTIESALTELAVTNTVTREGDSDSDADSDATADADADAGAGAGGSGANADAGASGNAGTGGAPHPGWLPQTGAAPASWWAIGGAVALLAAGGTALLLRQRARRGPRLGSETPGTE